MVAAGVVLNGSADPADVQCVTCRGRDELVAQFVIDSDATGEDLEAVLGPVYGSRGGSLAEWLGWAQGVLGTVVPFPACPDGAVGGSASPLCRTSGCVLSTEHVDCVTAPGWVGGSRPGPMTGMILAVLGA